MLVISLITQSCGTSSHSVTNIRCSWVGASGQETSIIKAFVRVELRTAVRPFHHLHNHIQNLNLVIPQCALQRLPFTQVWLRRRPVWVSVFFWDKILCFHFQKAKWDRGQTEGVQTISWSWPFFSFTMATQPWIDSIPSQIFPRYQAHKCCCACSFVRSSSAQIRLNTDDCIKAVPSLPLKSSRKR